MQLTDLFDVVQLMEMEYAEMPELKLTFWQARCLWNLPSDLCERALGALIGKGFLTRTAEGAYIRRTP